MLDVPVFDITTPTRENDDCGLQDTDTQFIKWCFNADPPSATLVQQYWLNETYTLRPLFRNYNSEVINLAVLGFLII